MIKKLMIYRWIIWGVLLTAYLIVIFHRYSFGIIKDELSGSFNMSSTAFANLSSMYFYAYMLMQIPTGILVDSLGVRFTVTIGMLLAGAGSLLFGYSRNIYIVFTGRFLIGIGVSVVFVSILKILSKWYDEKEFGTMTGLTSFIGNIAGILAQSPFVLLLSLFTWRYVFIMIGVVTSLVAVLCFTIVRNKPEDVGFLSILRAGEADRETENTGIIKALMEILGNPYTWPSFIMYAGFFGAYQSLAGTWGQGYIIEVFGMNKITAANYIVLMFVGGAAGSIIIGKLSDILSRRKVPMIIFGAMYLVSWTFLVFYNKGKPPVEILGLLFFIFGFSESTITLSWACGKEVNNPRYTGISTSVINIGGFFGAAVVPLILGMVMDRYKNILSIQQLYSRSFSFCLASAALGFVCILLIKETGCKNIRLKQERNSNY